MAIGLVGKKIGMSRVFNAEGAAIPVTVLEVGPNRITQIKSEATDGYRAVQVTIGERRLSRVTKPMVGHFAKAGARAPNPAVRTGYSLPGPLVESSG